MSDTPLPLVLVPGFLSDARAFGPQIRTISAFRPVHVAWPGRATRLADMASAILETAPPKFALAGHSMGGMIAFEMWRAAPERIERLALLDTSFLPETPTRSAERDVQLAQVRAGQFKRVLSDDLAPGYASKSQTKRLVVQTVIEMGLAAGPDTFVAQVEALRHRADSSDLLEQIDVPTLVLCGSKDSFCPVSRHEIMAARIRDAELIVVDDAGHFPMLDEAEVVTTAMLRWLTDALVLT